MGFVNQRRELPSKGPKSTPPEKPPTMPLEASGPQPVPSVKPPAAERTEGKGKRFTVRLNAEQSAKVLRIAKRISPGVSITGSHAIRWLIDSYEE